MRTDATILIDDFSAASETRPDTTVYQYGDLLVRRYRDTDLDGSVDDVETDYTGLSGFYRDDFQPFTLSEGLETGRSGQVHERAEVSFVHEPYDSPDATPLHGDRTLAAFDQVLARGSDLERILIDVDAAGGGLGAQLRALFLPRERGDGAVTSDLEKVLIETAQARGPTLFHGVSMSIAGTPASFDEAVNLASLNSLGIPFVQSAPNVGQGFYDYGSNYENTLNVGAWNVDGEGDLLASSVATLDTIDVLADGTVTVPGWGTAFGTSFATPRVSAALSNAILAATEGVSNDALGPDGPIGPRAFAEVQSRAVDAISEDVRFTLALGESGTVRVLAEDVTDGAFPQSVAGVEGIDGLRLVQARVTERPGQGLSPAEAEVVALLYEAALDRDGAIGREGLNFWIDRREAGLSEAGLAARFLASAEFEAAFGDPLDPADPRHLDDAALVAALYGNVLDRPAAPSGAAFWQEVLARPDVSRPDLLLAFATSDEARAAAPQTGTLEEVAPGEWAFA